MNSFTRWLHPNVQTILARPAARRLPTSRRPAPRFKPWIEVLEERCALSTDVVLAWNHIALDALQYDSTLGARALQNAPTLSSRALAIESVAVFDAVNSIDRSYAPYRFEVNAPHDASITAAAAQAAHDTLVALLPDYQSVLDAKLAADLASVPSFRSLVEGVAVGHAVAEGILAQRSQDGSQAAMTYTPGNLPGQWQPDPLHPNQTALDPQWGQVTPFALQSGDQFQVPPPPALTSQAYADAYNEVKALGGDGVTTPTVRPPEQTQIGIFWGYDGSPGVGTPPVLYNQIAETIAVQKHNTLRQNARLFALINIAMADAGISAWDVKYDDNFWRPITAIRAGGTDGNPATTADPNWTPLGAPKDNGGGTNFTPPFPAYPSGHATFGGALFRILADFYGTDNISFTIGSDEFNGVTRDQNGVVRPVVLRSYTSFSQAAQENAMSRIYLGIHWSFDATQGLDLGTRVADYVFNNFLQPVHGRGNGRADHSSRPPADVSPSDWPSLTRTPALDGKGASPGQPPVSTGYRPIDEVGNNIANPTEGTANTDLLRLSPAAYADGVSAPSLANDPSARVVSDILNNQADRNNPSQDVQTVDQQSLSDFGYAWGQFIDHDMDLTPTDSGEFLQILADPNDPSQLGNQTFERSSFDPSTGTSTSNPRQQINAVTSFLDLSQVYGSTAAVADALRTHVGGQLKTSPGNMLPYDNSTYFTPDQLAVIHMANDSGAVPTQDLFVTGDVRGNENVELTALQTLFVRNHNRIAAELQQEHPGWSDEQLYQEARKLNIADYQEITYNEYLPDLLGPNALPRYTGYNPNVDPAIATEFSTVAFRFGHSLLSSNIERQGNNGQDVLPNDPAGAGISLATDFFDPYILNPNGVVDPLTGHLSTDIGPILKADADGVAQADDLLAINDVRNLLFANGGLTDNGQDLIARDIERARDNGIGTYNQVRAAYGLAPVTSFAQITKNVQVQKELQQAYGSVANIDPFEGGLAEDHVPGSDMGPLFTRILADQFTRLRDGDRFFYLNESFNQDERNILNQGNTLAKVIEANTNITNLQSDVFIFKASISGTVLSAPGGTGQRASPARGLPGVTVQLADASGNALASTMTDSKGQYRFDQLTGIDGTGNYTVRLVVPSGFRQTSANPPTISISRGDVNVNGVNFSIAPGQRGAPTGPAWEVA